MALFQKYPNPISTHVLASDILVQRIIRTEESNSNETSSILYTKRLILKTNKVPFWAAALIPRPQGYVLEESWVDPIRKSMTVQTVNLSYSR